MSGSVPAVTLKNVGVPALSEIVFTPQMPCAYVMPLSTESVKAGTMMKVAASEKSWTTWSVKVSV